MNEREPATRRNAGTPEAQRESPAQAEKQRAIDTLVEAFANDELEVDEFERRVAVAHRAGSSEELRRLLADLPSGNLPAPAGGRGSSPAGRPASARPAIVSPDEVRDWSLAVGIMGATTRAGYWVPARRNVAVALMGGCELDFREAAFGPGVTEVHVVAVWGGVEIVVPPWLHLETSGVGIMGAFEHVHDSERPPRDPDRPVLRISGLALMGGVEVVVRLPGESARDARRRIKEQRKAARLRSGGSQGPTRQG